MTTAHAIMLGKGRPPIVPAGTITGKNRKAVVIAKNHFFLITFQSDFLIKQAITVAPIRIDKNCIMRKFIFFYLIQTPESRSGRGPR